VQVVRKRSSMGMLDAPSIDVTAVGALSDVEALPPAAPHFHAHFPLAWSPADSRPKKKALTDKSANTEVVVPHLRESVFPHSRSVVHHNYHNYGSHHHKMHHPPPIVEESSAGSEGVAVLKASMSTGGGEATIRSFIRETTDDDTLAARPTITVGVSSAPLSTQEQSRKRAFSLGNMNVVPK